MIAAKYQLLFVILTLKQICCVENEEIQGRRSCSCQNQIDSLQRDLQQLKARLDQLESPGGPTTNPSACPNGFDFSTKAGKCYRVMTERFSWENARTECTNLASGARLAVIESKLQDDAINEYLAKVDTEIQSCRLDPQHLYLFTSGHRTVDNCNSPFVWKPSDTETIPLTFTNWHNGEPNCWMGFLESCLQMDNRGDGSYKWNDNNCASFSCSICEVNASFY